MPETTVIGLLGGVAAGKSTVARLFAEEGALVLDADLLAREAGDRPEVARQVEERLGPGLLTRSGRLRRAALADRIFADPEARRFLEGLIHPLVLALIRTELAAARGRTRLVVLDVPLLLESGLDGECDLLVFVEASAGTRESRAVERGWSSGERDRREKNQAPIENKRARANYRLLNDGSLDSTRAHVRGLVQQLG